MWNVVHMDDGKAYLVDVTNCDGDAVGAPDLLFLKGYSNGSYAETYTVQADRWHQVVYTYGNESRQALGEAQLTLANTDYEPPAESVWQECGTCLWRIENDGTLVVKPASGNEGTLADWITDREWRAPWHDRTDDIMAVRFEGTVHALTCYRMFEGCSQASSIDLSGLDTSQVTDMGYMFAECSALGELDLSGLDTSSVGDWMCTFTNCSSLSSLDLSALDTSSSYDMGYMLQGCDALEEWKVGEQFVLGGPREIGSDDHSDALYEALPKNPDGRWWSAKAHQWFTNAEICDNRLGIADTYTRKKADTNLEYAKLELEYGEVTYSGKKMEPSVVVILCGTPLEQDVDYGLSYENNTDAGTATVTVRGIGDYSGEASAEFEIAPADLSAAEVAPVPDQAYEGTAAEPPLSVSLGGRELAAGTDYEVSYASNDAVGTATATATGRGNYAGTVTVPFALVRGAGDLARLSGDGRYDTMASIVGEGFDSSEWAVVAYGRNFPDALAAAPLAGMRDCPVVLTEGSSLSAQAREVLGGLGVRHAYVMGGTGVVSGAVEADLEAMGIEVVRVAGSDRQQTSVMALRELAEARPTTVVVATGRNYADTLSIGPWCYREAAPILLTGWDDRLTEEQVAAVRACPSVTGVVIVGGTGAVSADVEGQLAGYEVERLAGSDRYATSALVAEWEIGRGMGVSHAAVATGANFPDALAGAALCGRNDSVLLLSLDTDYGSVGLRDVLEPRALGVERGYVLGGEGAVPEGTLDYLRGITG